MIYNFFKTMPSLALVVACSHHSFAEPPSDPSEQLIIQCKSTDPDILKTCELIKAGADVNATYAFGVTVLALASERGHTDIVKLLLDAHADVNATDTGGGGPLIRSSWSGHVDVVKLLLDAGADLELASGGGTTALVVASREGHTDVVQTLLKAGAEVNKATRDGSTALLAASEKGHYEVVQLLIDANADTNLTDSHGLNSAAMASMNRHSDVLKLLIESNIDVNAPRKDGITALMMAVNRGHIESVKLLLEAGADVNATTADGHTALIIASKKGQDEIIKILKEYAAKPVLQPVANSKLTGHYYRDKSCFFPNGRNHKREAKFLKSLYEGVFDDYFTPDRKFSDEQNLAVEYDVAFSIATEMRAIYLKPVGNVPDIWDKFRQKVEHDPDYWAKAFCRLGIVLCKVGRWEESVDAFRDAVEESPRLSVLWGNLGIAENATGNYARSLSAFKKACEIDSTYFQRRPTQLEIHHASTENQTLE